MDVYAARGPGGYRDGSRSSRALARAANWR
jgi:hypothetical protein